LFIMKFLFIFHESRFLRCVENFVNIELNHIS